MFKSRDGFEYKNGIVACLACVLIGFKVEDAEALEKNERFKLKIALGANLYESFGFLVAIFFITMPVLFLLAMELSYRFEAPLMKVLTVSLGFLLVLVSVMKVVSSLIAEHDDNIGFWWPSIIFLIQVCLALVWKFLFNDIEFLIYTVDDSVLGVGLLFLAPYVVLGGLAILGFSVYKKRNEIQPIAMTSPSYTARKLKSNIDIKPTHNKPTVL